MKELKNLKGAKMICKTEQRAIKGGIFYACTHACPPESNCCTSNDICGVLSFRVCIALQKELFALIKR